MSRINRLPGWRPLLAGALTSTAIVGATSAPASAAGSATSVTVSSGSLVLTSAAGGDNKLAVTHPLVLSGTRYYYVTETGAGSTVVAGAGCSNVTTTQVRCASTAVTVGLSISTGDGNDRVDLSHRLVTRKSTIVAGDGTDVILPGGGADSIFGGTGLDLVTYEHRTSAQPVTVTIDGVANDGGSGEGDNVRTDVEYLSGGAGNDNLTGSTGNNHVWGMAGSDTLVGNLGNDWLTSGDGNDTVWGSGGHDSLWGGNGDDDLRGHGGEDALRGEGGNDALDGGSSNDTYDGGAGNDFLMAIGLGTDALTGGSQWDSTWRDSNDSLSDLTPDENTRGYQHVVSSFYSVPGSYSTGLDAVGENLPDPAAEPEDVPNVTKKNYASSPLFGPSGPRKEDVDQGALGDCYFLARLGSLASTDPAYIRNSVAPLGDGSYVVRFWDNDDPHAATYVRVDADLWTNSANRPAYAGILPTGGAWVAIMEKAYAVARKDLVSYDSIDGGNGTKLVHVAVDGEAFAISNGTLTKEMVMSWSAQGQPAGAVADMVKAQNKTLLDWLHARRSENKAVGFGSVGNLTNSLALTSDNYRRSAHIMIIDHVNFDANGQPVSVTIYNPWGSLDNPVQGGPVQTISDPARIWHLISGGKVFRGYTGSLSGS